jgi:hypothetical protein
VQPDCLSLPARFSAPWCKDRWGTLNSSSQLTSTVSPRGFFGVAGATVPVPDDVNLNAIVHLLRTDPPRLPADCHGGRFAIDTDGGIYVILTPTADEKFLKIEPHMEDARWLKYTDMQATLGLTA